MMIYALNIFLNWKLDLYVAHLEGGSRYEPWPPSLHPETPQSAPAGERRPAEEPGTL